MISRSDTFYGAWITNIGRGRTLFWMRVHELRLSADDIHRRNQERTR